MRSAERQLLRTGLRYALGIRTVVPAVSSLAVLVLETPRSPALTVAVVLALNAWNLWFAYRFPRGSGRWLVPVDVLAHCAVCLSQAWTVDPEVNARGTNWVLVVASITVVSYPWQLSARALAAATVAIMAAYVGGAALAAPDPWQVLTPIQLWMGVEALLSRALYLLVRRGAKAADELVAHGERLRRDAAVAAARRADEREYLAALHDTASATLFMVGVGVVGGREQWLSRQAERDLKVITGYAEVPDGEADLVALLHEVIHHVPLRVRCAAPETLRMPAVEAVALCHGVREALTNVVRHAGVAEAEIRVERRGDLVVVEVADRGLGFDPARVTGHRYGVTRSLMERMARTGGRAEVVSSPGAGTVVRMECSLAAPAPPEGDAEVIAGRYMQGLRWAVLGMNLVILYALDLPKLLANLDSYDPWWAQPSVMAALTGVTAVAGVATARRRPLGWARWPLLAVVFAASVLGTASVRADHRLGVAHWSEGDAAWWVVLLLLDSGLPVFVLVVAAQYATTFAHVAWLGGSALTLANVVHATMIVLSFQITVGVIAAVLRPIARSAARMAAEEERLRTAEVVAGQLHQDRKERYAALGETTTPLLRGLASGELDPGDETVRRRCAVEAARMRRLFAEDATVPDPLLHELRACIELAERTGITVLFAERGERPPVPKHVRLALTEPVVAALATAASSARVTVVGARDALTVSVVADAPPESVTAVDQAGVITSVVTDGRQVRVKATWRGGT
ncbi:Signal transduction histidine kinase [Streptoalloteichus tenebrarius]|uniref:Signal transduction histidine kinase n=1 Tax=Streptoalloteichus tenebrarius (strain ATCC 17920 / DSM 40477 / JCM 4838 / CBS 697.72 / NBRC 16177 / NCIMB 11028 / NRRL B-12390 / A12253. 1 / ISP 5477) TaxID=1933 RepID=A0ABT1HUW6_STRSD|nr:ATP-binding protein [Streptoalloteichus tenebrarius]MCP2259315.1 Signal transduction histidine kinase [Streptoalloteichus tenebrarius]BFE99078.1 hypothetical protein GCM10020241_07540 [Streptoalloteichus tenebrarius]